MDFNAEINKCRNAIETRSYAAIGRLIGISRSEPRRWVLGIQQPKRESIVRLAKALDLNPMALGAYFTVRYLERHLSDAIANPAPSTMRIPTRVD